MASGGDMATEILLASSRDELLDTLVEIARCGDASNLRPAQLLLDIEIDERLRQGLRADPERGHIVSEFRRQIDIVQAEQDAAFDDDLAYESYGAEDEPERYLGDEDIRDEHRAIDREQGDEWLDGGEVDELLEDGP